jgi:hypothetical protein
MGLPLFPAPRLGTLPFCVANLAAFLEDLLHEIISGKDSARAAPILGTSRPSVIGKQGMDVSLPCRHSFFKRSAGHDLILRGGRPLATAPRSANRRVRDGFHFSLGIQINARFLRGCFDLLQDVHHQVFPESPGLRPSVENERE